MLREVPCRLSDTAVLRGATKPALASMHSGHATPCDRQSVGASISRRCSYRLSASASDLQRSGTSAAVLRPPSSDSTLELHTEDAECANE